MASPRTFALRLYPDAIGMQKCIVLFRELVAGKEGDVLVRHGLDPRQQQIGILLRALSHHESQNQAPHRGKGQPDPGIAIGVAGDFGKGSVCFFRRHEAPQFIQLAFRDMQATPEVQHYGSAVQSGPVQPVTHGIFVDLQDTASGSDGISFRQCAHGGLENRRLTFQAVIGRGVVQSNTSATASTERLWMTIARPVFDHFSRLEHDSIQ